MYESYTADADVVNKEGSRGTIWDRFVTLRQGIDSIAFAMRTEGQAWTEVKGETFLQDQI